MWPGSFRRWLQGLRLEQYAATFEGHLVGDDILPSLTSEDLREMGVTALGDRRRMLDAIRKLPPAASAPPAAPVFHGSLERLASMVAASWSEKGVRLAQKTQAGPCVPVGTQR